MENPFIWNQFYSSKKILKYPDENLVRILEKLNIENWKKVLDFGCGTGRHIKYFIEKNIPEIYGIDYSEEAIQICKKLYPNANLYISDSLKLPFQENFFDCIIVWGVLHYNSTEKRNFLLKEFQRTLKKNGYLIGTYRSKEDTHFRNSEVKNLNIFFFEEKEIKQELEQFFSNIKLGLAIRTPVGNLEQKIAHYFFICQKL